MAEADVPFPEAREVWFGAFSPAVQTPIQYASSSPGHREVSYMLSVSKRLSFPAQQEAASLQLRA